MKPFITLFEDAGTGSGSAGGSGGGSLMSQAAQGGQQQQQPGGSGTPDPWAIADPKTGAFTPGWTERLPDSLKPAAADFGKYPDLQKLLEGAWNAKQLVGKRADGVLVPGPDAKPEQIAAFRKAIGVPEKPEGYGLKKPEKLPEGVEWPEDRMAKLAAVAHEAGIPPAALQKIVEFSIAANGEAHSARKLAAEKQKAEFMAAQKSELQKAWGNDMTTKANMAARAAITFGLDPNDGLFDNAKVVMAFAKVGEAMSEDKLVTATAVSNLQDPQAQAMDVMKNPNNPHYSRYHDGDRETVAMVQRLLGKS